MAIQSRYRHTLTVKRNVPTGTLDDYGQPVVTEATFATVPGLIQPRDAREVALASQAGAVIGEHVGYLDPLAGLSTADWIEKDGIRFDLLAIYDAGGVSHHLELALEQVTQMAGASGLRRMTLNRAAFDAIDVAAADGLFEWAKAIVNDADVPDAAPYGVGLVQGGAALAFIGRKRVAAWSKTGDSVTKPRAARLTATAITVIGGYGRPGRFLEEGTVHARAKPFLTPALLSAQSDAQPFIKAACIKRRVISSTRRAAGDVFKPR